MPPNSLCGRGERIAVTGATGGIGEATARYLSQECGASVIVGGRNLTRCEEIASAVGGKAVLVDLSTPAAAYASGRRLAKHEPTVVVNNAAVMKKSREETLTVNLVSTFALTLALLKKTRIVNVSSSSHLRAKPFYFPSGRDVDRDLRAYSASKLGLMHSSQMLRCQGHRVTDVHPGIVWTPMLKGFAGSRMSELGDRRLSWLRRRVFKDPEEGAYCLAVAALASEGEGYYVVNSKLQKSDSSRISPFVRDPSAIRYTWSQQLRPKLYEASKDHKRFRADLDAFDARL